MAGNVETTIDEKMVFAIGQMPDGVPMLILGVPAGAWDHMKSGNTHHFDLTKIGYPVRLMMFGGADHATVKANIDAIMAAQNVVTDNRIADNMGIDAPDAKE